MKELAYTTNLSYESEHKLKTNTSGWIKYSILGLAAVIPVIVFAFAPSRCWGAAIFAYINCLLYVVFAVHFISKGTLGYLIPVISPVWMIVGSCVGIIYFAVFYPDAIYSTLAGDVSYFAGGIRYQLAIFLFLLVYFVSMNRFLRNESVIPQHPLMVSKYIGYVSLALSVLITCFHIFAVIVHGSEVGMFQSGEGGWGYRLHYYFKSLWFVVGVVFLRLSRVVKMIIMVFLTIVLAFYSLLSSRTPAVLPIASMFCGLFLFSEMKGRTKIILLLVCVAALPWFVLIGNTVRILRGVSGGKYEDIGYRLAAFKEWRYVAERLPVGINFFGRMFFVSGNIIVAYTPSQYPYKHFSPIECAKETVVSMLPGPVQKFTGIVLDMTKTQYTGSWVLRDYGIYVSETTSTEVSMIGTLWMLGGYIPVLIGGFLLAMIHSFVAWIIRRTWVQNPDKGIFYFSVFFYGILWSFNWDLIVLWRTTILQFVFAYFGFKLISPFLRIGYAAMEEQYKESTLGRYRT